MFYNYDKITFSVRGVWWLWSLTKEKKNTFSGRTLMVYKHLEDYIAARFVAAGCSSTEKTKIAVSISHLDFKTWENRVHNE